MDTKTPQSELTQFAIPRAQLPAIVQQRIFQFSLNNLVEVIVRRFLEEPNEEFLRLIEGLQDSQCMEGTRNADNHEAARMIRAWAKKNEANGKVAHEKLGPIVKSMNIVLRRYHLYYKQRRNLVQDQQVPGDDNGDN